MNLLTHKQDGMKLIRDDRATTWVAGPNCGCSYKSIVGNFGAVCNDRTDFRIARKKFLQLLKKDEVTGVTFSDRYNDA